MTCDKSQMTLNVNHTQGLSWNKERVDVSSLIMPTSYVGPESHVKYVSNTHLTGSFYCF